MGKSVEELPNDALDELAHVPFDDALDALNHIQRRKSLFALLDSDSQGDSSAPLGDSMEEAGPLQQLVPMNHAHLPTLAEYGFIDWDRDTQDVQRGPKYDEIEPLLELLADHRDELPGDWL